MHQPTCSRCTRRRTRVDALESLQRIDPRAARVAELKFLGGLTNDEAAQVLGISLATVKRDWLLACAWLFRELSGAALLA